MEVVVHFGAEKQKRRQVEHVVTMVQEIPTRWQKEYARNVTIIRISAKSARSKIRTSKIAARLNVMCKKKRTDRRSRLKKKKKQRYGERDDRGG